MTFRTITGLRMRIGRSGTLMTGITACRSRCMVIPQPSGVKMTVRAIQALLMWICRAVDLMAGITACRNRCVMQVCSSMTGYTICFYDVGDFATNWSSCMAAYAFKCIAGGSVRSICGIGNNSIRFIMVYSGDLYRRVYVFMTISAIGL